MKQLKIIILMGSCLLLKMNEIESKDSTLSIPNEASPTFLKAWKLAEDQALDANDLELAAKIKRIQACADCTPTEKQFFITLLNNPTINLFNTNILVDDLEKFSYYKQLCDVAEDDYKCQVRLTHHILQVMFQNALKKNQVELVELLIDAGVYIQGDPASSSPLIHAISLGNKEMVQLLVDKGASIKFKGFNGDTALKVAERKGYKDIVEILKKAAWWISY